MNISGTLNAFRALLSPTLLLPQSTIPTFASLPLPLSSAFPPHPSTSKPPKILGVVLDKDNCFALPHTSTIHAPYTPLFASLRTHYPRTLLIVSNTAGASSADPSGRLAEELERNTGVPVLRHRTKKPGCGDEIMRYFRGLGEGIERPDQVAVVGDRLFTDVLMANMMGAWGVWIRDGVRKEDLGLVSLAGVDEGARG